MIPIILPLAAIILPVLVIFRAEKNPVKRPFLYSMGSFACGFGALFQELYAIYQRCMNNDYSGIEDTIGAVLMISIGIIVVILVLNSIALSLSYGTDE